MITKIVLRAYGNGWEAEISHSNGDTYIRSGDTLLDLMHDIFAEFFVPAPKEI